MGGAQRYPSTFASRDKGDGFRYALPILHIDHVEIFRAASPRDAIDGATKTSAERISTSRARQGRNGHAQDNRGRDRGGLSLTDRLAGGGRSLRYRGAPASLR